MRRLLLIPVVALLVTVAMSAAGAPAEGPVASACKPTLQGGVVHFCGPATGHLSVFPGVTFRHGSCVKKRVNGKRLFEVELGVRTQDARHNSGRRYFGLSVSGPLSNPTGGGVIAYAHSKRWGGAGVSFNGNATHGKFVAKGINGSRGKAHGSYRCS